MSDVEIVAASDDDVRSLARERSFSGTALRLGLEAAGAGFAWAARDGSETVGWALAQSFDGVIVVADLFVAPSFRRQGIGGRLLDAAFARDGDTARWMLFETPGLGSFVLAARRRLVPLAVWLRFAGPIPSENALLALAVGDHRFDVDTIDAVVHRFALDELDRSTIGFTRTERHARYAGEALGTAFFLRGEFVGYAYVWPDGRIGPVASASPAYVNQMLAYAMLTLRRSCGATWCSALIPAAAPRLVSAVLHEGLSIEETFLLVGDVPAPDLGGYVARDLLAL